MLNDDLLYSPQFFRREAKISGQFDWFQPEFRRLIIPIHVHMRGFIGLVAVEIQSIGAAANNRRHEGQKRAGCASILTRYVAAGGNRVTLPMESVRPHAPPPSFSTIAIVRDRFTDHACSGL